MGTVKVRQSSVELLRIVAILCVLIGHTRISLESGHYLGRDAASVMTNSLVSAFTVGGVDVFVLISGWFGIRANTRGLMKFVFQVLFLSMGIFLVSLCLGIAPFSLKSIQIGMSLTEEYWFVMAYLGLYLFSPLLNTFCEHTTEKQLRVFLMVFYFFQTYYCWLSGYLNYFGGYSIVFFMGLYLTARYVRLYPVNFLERRPWKIYLVCCLVVFAIASMGQWLFGNALRMLRYDNPLVIMAAIALLRAFSRIQFQSKFVNWLATSCFAVYIIHFNPFVFPFFKSGVWWMADRFGGILFVLGSMVWLMVVFFLCVLVDQLRIFSWNKMYRQ